MRSDSQTDPEIVPPSHWGARRSRVPLPERGLLDHLVLHHTAYLSTRIGTDLEAQARHMRQIESWHVARGFLAIGYHFVISPTGRIFGGRPLDRMGAHVKGHNRGTVGICLMGNFEREQPTVAALAALAAVQLRLIPGGREKPLAGHREHSGQATACPGRSLDAYLRRKREGRSRAALAGTGSNGAY